jgi:flagellar hook assembly protein FlgD
LNIYPNPFNPDTTISFELSKSAPTSVKIYNLKGQLVATVLDAEMAAGKHNISWKGKDYRGQSVASGLYFIRVQSGQYCSTRKAILMK